jgi:shikimate kinase
LPSDNQLEPQSATPPRRIVLTGFMGSGKSTVGPLIASRLGWQFIDVDNVIEAETGAAIAEIFARHGESAFRDHEHATIARLATSENLILALGGGAIEREDTRELLLNAPGTLLVHLEVELNTTLARCSGTENTRPVLADHANLAARYHRRLPLYRAAHVSIRADARTPDQVADAVLEAAGLLRTEDLYNELAYYTLAHPDPVFIHQLVVDAYAAQNADESTKPISIVFALIGLYLHLEKGFTGRQVQRAHMQLAKWPNTWVKPPLPRGRGEIRIQNVLAAEPGPTRDAMIERWCASVWDCWQPSRAQIVDLARKYLGTD